MTSSEHVLSLADGSHLLVEHRADGSVKIGVHDRRGRWPAALHVSHSSEITGLLRTFGARPVRAAGGGYIPVAVVVNADTPSEVWLMWPGETVTLTRTGLEDLTVAVSRRPAIAAA